MEYTYSDRAGETGLVKTGLSLIAVFAAGLMPSNNHFIPQQTSVNYGEYAQMNTQSVVESNTQRNENKQIEILFSFASKLAENTKDLDNDIAQIISNDFWEMYDRF